MVFSCEGSPRHQCYVSELAEQMHVPERRAQASCPVHAEIDSVLHQSSLARTNKYENMPHVGFDQPPNMGLELGNEIWSAVITPDSQNDNYLRTAFRQDLLDCRRHTHIGINHAT